MNRLRALTGKNVTRYFKNLVSKLERRPGQFFDCIIGVSGGKDSTRQAMWVRDKLGLRPLLVSLSHPPQQVFPAWCGQYLQLGGAGVRRVVFLTVARRLAASHA